MRLLLSTLGALGALQVLGVNAQADQGCIVSPLLLHIHFLDKSADIDRRRLDVLRNQQRCL